jgi:hypothetical protein
MCGIVAPLALEPKPVPNLPAALAEREKYDTNFAKLQRQEG